MANEATITMSLQLRKTDGSLSLIDYRPQPTTYQLDVTGVGGPTPGQLLATENGVDVDLSMLTTPGICRIHNMDPDDWIKVGRFDPDTNRYYPLLRVPPGMSQLMILDEDVADEYAGTGTGTTATLSTLRIKGVNGDRKVLVEAFEE